MKLLYNFCFVFIILETIADDKGKTCTEYVVIRNRIFYLNYSSVICYGWFWGYQNTENDLRPDLNNYIWILVLVSGDTKDHKQL